MIPCTFCHDIAIYAYSPAGIVWPGCDELIPFCMEHLRTYYLGLRYGKAAA